MNRFVHVLEILDNAVGGSTTPVAAHGAFWRGLTRNQFVSKKVFGLPLISVGNAAASNLVRALEGESPFGADLSVPPPGASFNRMPSGLASVSPDDQFFIRQWIDDGCPDETVPSLESPTKEAAPAKVPAVEALLADFNAEAPTIEWLKKALQLAVQLELSTLPPYLTARWTIKNQSDPVSVSIKEIRGEEMLHFGLASNLLVSIGGTLSIANAMAVPIYPGPLPGGVRPGLEVRLRRLSRDQAQVFMQIEYPHGGPIPTLTEATTYNSIGEFYAAILSAFQSLNPPLDLSRQIDGPLGLFKIDTLTKVKEAIDLINLQGEGTSGSPEEKAGDLAHYYRFAEIYHGRKLVQNSATGEYSFTGVEMPMPETWPMADIPVGGYEQADAPDPAIWNLISMFDQQYSEVLRNLEWAWVHGDDQYLSTAVGLMIQMGSTGRQLVQKQKPNGSGNFGPCFRFMPAPSPIN